MTMIHRLIAASALSLALIAVGAPANAQKKACQADVEKFCSKVEPGQGRIRKCLQEHSDELSAECKTALEKRKKAAQTRKAKRTPPAERRAKHQADSQKRAVCTADIEKYCKEFKGKNEQMMACLREHKADFSEECQKKVEQALKVYDQQKAGKK